MCRLADHKSRGKIPLMWLPMTLATVSSVLCWYVAWFRSGPKPTSSITGAVPLFKAYRHPIRCIWLRRSIEAHVTQLCRGLRNPRIIQLVNGHLTLGRLIVECQKTSSPCALGARPQAQP